MLYVVVPKGYFKNEKVIKIVKPSPKQFQASILTDDLPPYHKIYERLPKYVKAEDVLKIYLEKSKEKVLPVGTYGLRIPIFAGIGPMGKIKPYVNRIKVHPTSKEYNLMELDPQQLDKPEKLDPKLQKIYLKILLENLQEMLKLLYKVKHHIIEVPTFFVEPVAKSLPEIRKGKVIVVNETNPSTVERA